MPQLLQRDELERRLFDWVKSEVCRYPFFEGPISNSQLTASGTLGRPAEDLRRWFADIEYVASDCRVPPEQYPDVAIYFLRGDLKEVMTKRREAYIKETGRGWWDWKDFKKDLIRIVDEAARIVASVPPRVTALAADVLRPYVASSVKLGLIIGGTTVLLPALTLALRRLNEATTPVLNTPN